MGLELVRDSLPPSLSDGKTLQFNVVSLYGVHLCILCYWFYVTIR